MSDMRVGSALRAVRIRRGLRESDVASRAGVATGTISNLERGRLGGATLEMLRRVGAALLAWHAPTRSLLVIELKTELVDVNELLGVLDRKTRLAGSVARDRGWSALTVSTWLVMAESSTNRVRVRAVNAMLRAALPVRGSAVKAWLRKPVGRIAGLSFFQNFSGSSGKQTLASQQRVRVARPRSATPPE